MVVKSHRQLRHEREHNELADWLEERLEALRPYTAQLAVAAILIAVAVAAGVYYFNTENQLASQEWAEYFDAFNEREPQKALQELNAAKPESPAGLWAAQTLGDINLAQGAAQLFLDREQATEKLEAAKGFYQKAEAAKGDQNLVARARLGLGKVHEAMCQPEEALKYYKLVADEQKGTALGAAAEKAVQRMENPRTVEMLAWFATQTPKKPSPLPGEGGGLPGLPNDLPDRPDISPPLGLGLDDLGSGIPAGPDLSLPQPGTAPPPEPKPGEEPRPAEPNPEDAKTEPNADAKSLESPTPGTPE
jgi:tetratricopeptide (TPR) repeat protein